MSRLILRRISICAKPSKACSRARTATAVRFVERRRRRRLAQLYVTDFLTRAREHKIAVPDTAFKLAVDRLRNAVASSTDPGKNGGVDLAYALYVLARNGLAPIGDLRYIADAKLDDISTPIAKAQIAAALAMVGDRARAEKGLCGGADRDFAAGASRSVRPGGLRFGVARRRCPGGAGQRKRRAGCHGSGRGAAR